MSPKLPLLFVVSFIVGMTGTWGSTKLNWMIQDARIKSVDAQVDSSDSEDQSPSQSFPVDTPQGVTISPSGSYFETVPAEISVTFPFFPRAGDLTIFHDNLPLVQPGDDLVISNNAFVFPLPDSAASGVYSVTYTGCPDTSLENCLSGGFGFAVK